MRAWVGRFCFASDGVVEKGRCLVIPRKVDGLCVAQGRMFPEIHSWPSIFLTNHVELAKK
jgi:hypothetical protein